MRDTASTALRLASAWVSADAVAAADADAVTAVATFETAVAETATVAPAPITKARREISVGSIIGTV